MLNQFSFENFRSFRAKQVLTFVASSQKELSESLINVTCADYNLVPAAAIYGANASGKSNVIKALSFMISVVRNSHRNWQPDSPIHRFPFLLDEDSRNRPSSFELDFIVSAVRYRYGFVLDSSHIVKEWLYAYPSSKQQMWFVRSEGRFTFGRNLSGENRLIQELTRKNSLYLSAAAQNNHALLLPVYNYICNTIKCLIARDGVPTETLAIYDDKEFRDKVFSLLTSADLGILGVRAESLDADERFKEPFAKLVSLLKDFVKEVAPKAADAPDFSKISHPVFLHQSNLGQPAELPMHEESAGTVAYFWLLGPVVKAIADGGVLAIDELDSSLHPLLALNLLGLFQDRKRNLHGAQLLFNTHDTNLLSATVLRRDQIWFTEKTQRPLLTFIR